jgi:hypothetical protein
MVEERVTALEVHVENIEKRADECRDNVHKQLEAGRKEFGEIHKDIGEIKGDVKLILANGNHSNGNKRKQIVVTLGTGGGALAIILFLIQFIVNN